MAQVLQLTSNIGTTIDFYDGNLQVSADGWSTTTSNDRVWETLDLVGNVTDATIRSTKVSLDNLAEQAREYHLNPLTADAVWFQWNADGETLKQALVYEIQSEILAHEVLSSPLLGSNIVLMRVAIQRHPSYEPTSATTDSTTSVSTLGGTWSIGNIAGNMPQRIENINISKTTAVYTEQQIWMGIKPTYEGFSSFESVWEAEDGTLSGSTQADAGASGGNRVDIDLTATPTDGYRGQMDIGDVIGDTNYNHFLGKYNVLMRAKVDAADTQCLVELGQNWRGSNSRTGLTFIDGITNYTLFSLGTISLPPTGDRGNASSTHSSFSTCGFSLFVNSPNAGAGDELQVDCFVLIPAEYCVTVLGANVDSSNGSLDIYRDADEGFYGLGVSSQTQGGLQVTGDNWYYPKAGGLLVYASQPDSGHQLSQTINLSIELFPRWRNYRG